MKILFADISNTKPEESIPIFEANKQLVASGGFDQKSLFSLVDATGARFNSKLIQAIKETAKSNNPFIQATCVVGLTPLTKTIVNSIILFTGREIKTLDTLEEGKDWLHSQHLKHSSGILV